jgi:hypothetical protein
MSLKYAMIARLVSMSLAAIPDPTDKVATARWMVSTLDWGFLATTSTRSEGTSVGMAFGNPYSFADASNGVPYFYGSDLDASFADIFTAAKPQDRASLALSEAELKDSKNGKAACEIGTPLGDPENPPCARLVLGGKVIQLAKNTTEGARAMAALEARHPYDKKLPSGHDFCVAKMMVDSIWLIDAYGGAAIISPDDYFAYRSTGASNRVMSFPIAHLKSTPPRPNPLRKIATARWMAQTLDWGALSTISTLSNESFLGSAFGNPYSFASNPKNGTPYFFASSLDASIQDIIVNPEVTFALSEATLTGKDMVQSCNVTATGMFGGDPENPPCARLVFSGKFVKLAEGEAEDTAARGALFDRHPSFKNYPPGHAFFAAKLELTNIWLIDIFGGATIIKPSDYYASGTLSEHLIV